MTRGGPALTREMQDGIAVVTIALPDHAVNVISRSVKDEFVALFEELAADAAVKAVAFFSGKPDNFIAGADIEEFVQLGSAAEAERLSAEGQELLDRVARFPKPIAVGIHGACLGGGFEFALACHYRVATDHPRTQIGLPEIQLGILPAAGGCQRLPRLVGARAALDMILAGKTERAQKVWRLGMVDELVHPAVLRSVTTAAARRMADGWRSRRSARGGLAGLLVVVAAVLAVATRISPLFDPRNIFTAPPATRCASRGTPAPTPRCRMARSVPSSRLRLHRSRVPMAANSACDRLPSEVCRRPPRSGI